MIWMLGKTIHSWTNPEKYIDCDPLGRRPAQFMEITCTEFNTGYFGFYNRSWPLKHILIESNLNVSFVNHLTWNTSPLLRFSPKELNKFSSRKDDPEKKATCAIFMLLLSGDVETNPGPMDNSIYLCPFCELKVDYGMRALQCDDCEMWYHRTCISMCTEDYISLENNSKTYLCCRCDHPNYILNTSSREIPTHNSFESLTNLPQNSSQDTPPIEFSPRK